MDSQGVAMIKPKRPQRGDVVITRAVDGFWTLRPLEDSHTPGKVQTFEAAIASGGLTADLERVDLWLMDDEMRFWILGNRRRMSEPDHGVNSLPAWC